MGWSKMIRGRHIDIQPESIYPLSRLMHTGRIGDVSTKYMVSPDCYYYRQICLYGGKKKIILICLPLIIFDKPIVLLWLTDLWLCYCSCGFSRVWIYNGQCIPVPFRGSVPYVLWIFKVAYCHVLGTLYWSLWLIGLETRFKRIKGGVLYWVGWVLVPCGDCILHPMVIFTRSAHRLT